MFANSQYLYSFDVEVCERGVVSVVDTGPEGWPTAQTHGKNRCNSFFCDPCSVHGSSSPFTVTSTYLASRHSDR